MRTTSANRSRIGKMPGFPRVLKQVAKAPLKLRSVNPRATRTLTLSPSPGEEPLVILRVQIIGCKDLVARDKNGSSDPFVVVSLAKERFSTPHLKKTLNPVYDPNSATFNVPIYESIAGVASVLELLIWDKDLLGKEYLGEVSLSVEDWFKNRAIAFDDANNSPLTLHIISTRTKAKVSGTIEVKLGLVKSPTTQSKNLSLSEVYDGLVLAVEASAPSILSAPPTRGIGTVRSRMGPDLGGSNAENGEESDIEDDGLSSEDEAYSDDGEFFDAEGEPMTNSQTQPGQSSFPPTAPGASALGVDTQPLPAIVASPDPTSISPTTPSSTVANAPVNEKRPGRLPRLLSGFKSNGSKEGATPSTFENITPATGSTVGGSGDYLSAKPIKESSSRSGSLTPGGSRIRRPKFKKRKNSSGYALDVSQDIQGIVMLEIAGAEDLPKVRNMTRLTWDMDPFVVVSFSKKVFRTRVIRHSLNPAWEEKLLFHVRKYEENYEVKFAVLDWDKLTGNDQVGEVSLPLHELMVSSPKPDPKTGLYAEGVETPDDMKEFVLPLTTSKDSGREAKHSPKLTLRAKYQPYDALRQRFWRQYLKQYDLDETGSYSRIELQSMLDSLGSTLTKTTLNDFFTRYDKNPETDEISIEEAIMCLENAVSRPSSERNVVTANTSDGIATGAQTPNLNFSDFPSVDGISNQLDFIGLDAPSKQAEKTVNAGEPLPEAFRESNQRVLPGQGPPANARFSPNTASRQPSGDDSLAVNTSANFTPSPSDSSDFEYSPRSGSLNTTVERVINIKTCPLCHQPRLSNKGEQDIVTHLAVCASSDWNRVNRIVVGNYVTASQAQRKWYTNVVTKVSSGAYQLGANSANIIVQNRLTGQLEEEKMQAFVRLGIRLLYKGASGRMEGGKARRLLKSMSIKQGLKYDSPESAREIPAFIEFHKLKLSEVRDPLDSFKTFNQFFYRKLREDARPLASPEDPSILVSGADCRMMAFSSVQEATKLWIKGREFTISKLLGPAYGADISKYTGGALAIFRLAPQDYHRFHSPVDGVIGTMTYVSGEYYTVNPQAVRSNLDIYGENARKIVPIDSPRFGRVYAVCVGAMMVGSIITTKQEGESVARGEEFGYFAFGGSTIVLLFEKGVVQFDEDLLLNGEACLETLVRVGMKVGRSVRPPSHA